MDKPKKIPTHKLRKLAVEAEADPRTVQKVYEGKTVRGLALERVRRVLAAAGLLAALLLFQGCAEEGVGQQLAPGAGGNIDPSSRSTGTAEGAGGSTWSTAGTGGQVGADGQGAPDSGAPDVLPPAGPEAGAEVLPPMGGTGSGGATGSGGWTGAGGTTSGGGSTGTTAIDCPDISTYSNFVTGQYGATTISLSNSTTKNYYMQANWWGSPYGNQAEEVSGIGFKITGTNPTSIVTSNPSLPLGYPSIFIGTYKDKRTTGSNLPKAVSALTSVPTIFRTNVNSKGDSNYNAAYDVWLTAGSGTVSGNNPGSGGAYLMVWLFMPTDKYPRGTLRGNETIVTGVKGGWNVWYDPSVDNIPCVSYVASNKVESIEFDLKYFIDDAIASGYGVKSSQYLSIIFAGFEVWGGGDGLQVNHFCANVK